MRKINRRKSRNQKDRHDRLSDAIGLLAHEEQGEGGPFDPVVRAAGLLGGKDGVLFYFSSSSVISSGTVVSFVPVSPS